MKSIASLMTIAGLAVTLSGCPDSGGGGGNASNLAITTTSANFAVAGNPYSSTLAATGGTPPYTWAAVSVLPGWVLLNPMTGVLTGTPGTSDVGNFNLTFRVKDTTGATAVGTVLLAVHNRTDILSVDNSTPPVPGGAASSSPSISNDGRFVAFVSTANLIPGVGGSQIYLHDWQTNQTSLISRDSGVAINAGNGISSAPSISSDGHFVAFVSNSTNLVSGVSGQQIYLRNVQTGVTTLVSKDNLNNPATLGSTTTSPSISSTGRFIAYVSNATNLVAGVLGGQQIYLYDTQITMAFPNGQTTLVSKDNSPTPLPGDGASSAPSISQDGCFVAFASLSTNLISPSPGNQQVYVRGPLPGPGTCGAPEQTSLMSQDNSASPLPGNGFSSSPSINSDGRFVTFTSASSNLLTGVSGQQIYLHDRNSGPNGTTSLVSKDNSALPVQGNGSSSVPSISQDGCFVAFASLSTNFGVAGGNQQIYIRGPLPGPGTCGVPELTSLVSKDNSVVPVAGNAASDAPSVNANGGFVAFSSLSTNFGVAGGNQQIFVRAMP
ncbi:MAG TPA: putative Ig domain-containing protein [Nitrospiraceae bacterium]